MPISPVAGVWRTFSPQQKTSGHCNRLDSEFEILHEIMRSLIESFCYSVWTAWWVLNIFIGDIFTRATHLVTTSQQYLWIIPEWRNKNEKRAEVPTDNNDDLFNIFIFNKISGAMNNRRKNIINSMARNAIARSTYLWVAGRVFSLHVMRVKRGLSRANILHLHLAVAKRCKRRSKKHQNKWRCRTEAPKQTEKVECHVRHWTLNSAYK